MVKKTWTFLKIDSLAENLRKYSDYLKSKNEEVLENHARTKLRLMSDNEFIEVIDAKSTTKPTLLARYKRITEAIVKAEFYTPICIDEFTTTLAWSRHRYMKELTVPVRITKFTHSDGKNNLVFIWKVRIYIIRYGDGLPIEPLECCEILVGNRNGAFYI